MGAERERRHNTAVLRSQHIYNEVEEMAVHQHPVQEHDNRLVASGMTVIDWTGGHAHLRHHLLNRTGIIGLTAATAIEGLDLSSRGTLAQISLQGSALHVARRHVELQQ